MEILKKNRLLNVIVFLAFLSLNGLNGCKRPSTHENAASSEKNVKYTCPMHPQIIQDKPGTCPICKMDLVAMNATTTAEASLMLSDRQIQLANITTMKVGQGTFNSSKVINGRLVTNPQQTEIISSRVSGRIERLFIKETGRLLTKGEPLFQVYSEQLQVLQQDYLVQIKQVAAFPQEKIYQSLRDAARNKLKLFGYTNAQIKTLEQQNKVQPTFTVYSTASGVVNEINVSEGQYVSEGSPVLRLENYNRLWVEADVYPSEVNHVAIGSSLKIIVNGLSDVTQIAKVDFISPALNPSTQRITIRAAVANSSGQFQPGMQATVFLSTGRISGGISVPLQSVIRDENASYVWIKTEDHTFKARRVVTGPEDANKVVIVSGISGGEEVVTTGAYLLQSEFILKNGSIL